MRLILPKLLAILTRKSRYIPDIKWSDKSLVHNLFRAYELVFGRRHGIRCESSTSAEMDNDGKVILNRKFFTVEAVLAHLESVVRNGFKFNFEWVELPQLQLAGLAQSIDAPQLPIFTFAIAIDVANEGYVNGTNLSYSHTVTGSDTYISAQSWTFSGGDSISAVTYAGEALTERGQVATDASGQLYIHSAAGANTGSNTLQYTNSSSQVFSTVASYTGVDQSTPCPDTVLTGNATNSSFTISTTNVSVDQSWILMSVRSPSKVPTAGSGCFVRKTNTTSADCGTTLDSNGGRSTGANTMDFSWTGSSALYYVIGNFAPTAGGASVNSNFFAFM